ncbi:MAG: DUF4197 domain-containing protein [Sideroxydans sp.]|nr:DUF4197 domain-containing protein [Sideroxydans sp.]
MRPLLLIALLALSVPASAFDLNSLQKRLNDIRHPPAATPAAASAPVTASAPAAAPVSGLAQFSAQDQVESLRQALTQGAETAVASLAKENGFLGNEKVRIPLPENLQKAERAMRKIGMGKYADELTTSMNRAAEAAVPEAKTLLVDAVKNMTVNDAKDILLGNDDAATQYFRRNTETQLAEKFKPVVNQSMQQVSLAQTYDRFAGKAKKVGLVKESDAHLDDYITRKALDGLFLMMAEQEKEIRAHPLQASSSLVQKIFSFLLGK